MAELFARKRPTDIPAMDPFGPKESAVPTSGSSGLFGRKESSKDSENIHVLELLNSLERRLKVLENRFTEISRKEQLTESNILSERKLITKEIKTIDSDILEVKREMNELKSITEQIMLDLRNFALKDDVAVIQKYVDLWEPIEFVTRNEVEKVVREMLRERANKHAEKQLNKQN